ncbi:LeuA family protein [Halomarina salina]|uniref:LeuA family protein n=1 Tax=Halomarina salina TaxID=1872699 RepID=A0ABD5RHV1_9EURY|nr:citramalate synthase [Halomarina salina]
MEILDLTLREGEQRPGRDYSVDQKVAVARDLDDLGVPLVQLGFPVGDLDVKAVTERLALDARTVGIARAIPGDVEAAVEAGVDVVDVFAPTSDRQRERLLGATPEEARESIEEACDVARDAGVAVHFSAMDGFRTDPETLNRITADLDAEYVTLADTVGARTPSGVVSTLDELDRDPADLGVHFHDDLGVATANALAAVEWGVEKVDASVGGVGERAGNTSLEQFVAAAVAEPGTPDPGVDLDRLIPTCERVLDRLDESVPESRPLLGSEVFSHESGLHTAAMLDDPATFEPFDPARFGGERHLVFGAASGRGAARGLLARADREVTDERVAALLDVLETEGPMGYEAAVDAARSVE